MTIAIPGGTMTWIIDDAIQPGIGLSLAEMTVDSGQLSELHCHDNCSEIIYLLEGEISQRIGNQWTDMSSGDNCTIPAGEAHQTRNTGAGVAKMILVYSEGQRNFQKLDEG